MKNTLLQFKNHLASINGALEELYAAASVEELDFVEQELGIKLPEDFRELYLTHNGQKGILFLFGEFRIHPLADIVKENRSLRELIDRKMQQVTDTSGTIKDCIHNPKWIVFGDNGGNTSLCIDLDPGQQGTMGQIIELMEGDDARWCYSGIKSFIADVTEQIASKQLVWDEHAGGFWDTEEESEEERELERQRYKAVETAPIHNREDVLKLSIGDEAILIGSMKPKSSKSKHKIYLKGGPIVLLGRIDEFSTELTGDYILVKTMIRVGGRTRFGLKSQTYKVLFCEPIPR